MGWRQLDILRGGDTRLSAGVQVVHLEAAPDAVDAAAERIHLLPGKNNFLQTIGAQSC